ncbi:MAG: glycosyltransferase [Bacteroidales bacterium]|nr:glycosyltransferase [Bacteroidales bacterium]MCF8402540.1 glycosyltransferase [Bacteroidales bacterium]
MNHATETYLEEYNMHDDVIYLNHKGAIKRFLELRKILKDNKIKALWTWGGFEASFGLILSITTRTIHINGSIRHGIISKKKSHYWRMLVLHLSQYRVANSKAGLRANKLKKGFVWYNGIDKKFLLSEESLARKPLATGGKIKLISVANLVPYKDYFTIFKSLTELKKKGYTFSYQIIGEGPMRHELKLYVNSSGLENEVLFLGRISNVQDHLAEADIFIHSSKGEGCSNAILEAMASGLPVIASATGGTPEIVSQGSGYLFSYKDDKELTDCLIKLLSEPHRISQMGQRSNEIIREKFTTTKMIENYKKIVSEIVK